jgi:8-oxo-dGTP pyrophosphatase MutT (NUDIX family)
MANELTTKRENYCGNCGEEGHSYRRCLAPIISLGVILYKVVDSKIYYLMVQRRDTLGFVEFMRGKYNLENYKYINELFKIMTESERIKILNNDFDYLWQNLWMNKNIKKFQNEYNNSKKKFIILKRGIEIDGKEISLLSIHKMVPIFYKTPEWGFPKGRRNNRESDLACAKREFEEESGYTSANYKINNSIEPIIELFSGTNNIRYKHVYYIGKSLGDINLTINKDNFNQVSEISKIKWFVFDEAYECIRPYNKEKKEVLRITHELLLKKIFVNNNED